jgi:hypothetical protein
MRRLALLVAMTLTVSACNQGDDTTGSTDACARRAVPSYNPKVLDQCVAACKQCERGVTVTCTTACKLRGAQ